METIITGLKAAGEPTRLRLLRLLALGEFTVSELTHILCQSQPRVSRHLKLLTEAGLVDRFPEGTWVFYRLAESARLAVNGTTRPHPENAALARLVVKLVRDDDEVIARDLERLQMVKRARADLAAAYFSAHAAEWDTLRALHLPERDVDEVLRKLATARPVKDLVDLGTGTGHVLELLAGDVEHGLGIDSSREMLAVARTNLERAGLRHCQVRQGDILSLSLPNECADLVTLHQVLHYLAEPARAVAEAARLLRPGGRLLIVDFAPHELEFLRTDHAHRRLGFGDEEIKTLCEDSGLKGMEIIRLPPKSAKRAQKLTVTLWLAVRPGGAARPDRTRTAHPGHRRDDTAHEAAL